MAQAVHPAIQEELRRAAAPLADLQLAAEAGRVDVRVVFCAEYRDIVMQAEARPREPWQRRPWRAC